MSNSCYVKNKKKITPNQLSDFLSKQLEEKFGLAVDSKFSKEDKCLVLVTKNLKIPIFINKESIEFFDLADVAFERYNQGSWYSKQFFKNISGNSGNFGAYSFLYEFMKNAVAKYLKQKLDSEGGGVQAPFENPERFNNLPSWLAYFDDLRKKNRNSATQKALHIALKAPSLLEVKKSEKKLFPELF